MSDRLRLVPAGGSRPVPGGSRDLGFGPVPERSDGTGPERNLKISGTTRTDWLAERVEAGRRNARRDLCARCSAPVLVGPDHDTTARVVVVEAVAVDRLAEVVAWLRGRPGYDFVGRRYLAYREPWHVGSAIARYPIHLQHECEEVEK
jgi:hypothetical protein